MPSRLSRPLVHISPPPSPLHPARCCPLLHHLSLDFAAPGTIAPLLRAAAGAARLSRQTLAMRPHAVAAAAGKLRPLLARPPAGAPGAWQITSLSLSCGCAPPGSSLVLTHALGELASLTCLQLALRVHPISGAAWLPTSLRRLVLAAGVGPVWLDAVARRCGGGLRELELRRLLPADWGGRQGERLADALSKVRGVFEGANFSLVSAGTC